MAEASSEMLPEVSLILGHFNKSKRSPNGLAHLWQETNQADNTSTAKIFLGDGSEEGFYAWYAYILLKGDANKSGHFSGKATCGRLIADLESTSMEHRASLAREVSRGIRSNKKLQGLYDKMTKQPDGKSQPLSKGSRAYGNCTTEHDLPDVSMSISSTISPSTDKDISSRDNTPPAQALVHLIPNHTAEPDNVVVNASLAEATRLFPQYLSEAVKRNPDPTNSDVLVAGIAMTFPDGRVTTGFGCQMTIHITDNKTEYLARMLFNAHLETTAGLRYVCIPGGAKVLPNPLITLRGCQLNIISSVFGTETHNGIIASPMYQEELKQGRSYTECVSMVISHKAHEVGILCVNLGLREGTLMKAKLFP